MRILLIGNRILSEQALASLLKENNLAAYTLSCIHGDMAVELLKKIDIEIVMVHADTEQDLTGLTDLLQRFKQEQPGTYIMLLLDPDDFSQISEALQEVVDDYLTLPIIGVELAIRAKKAGRQAQSRKCLTDGAADFFQASAEKQLPLPSIGAPDQLIAASIQPTEKLTSTEREPVNLEIKKEPGTMDQTESTEIESELNPTSSVETLAEPEKASASELTSEPEKGSTPEPASEPKKTLNPLLTGEQPAGSESDSSNNASGNAPEEDASEDWFTNLRASFSNSNRVPPHSKWIVSRTVKAAVFGLVILALGIAGVFLAQGKLSGGVSTDRISSENNPSGFFRSIKAWFSEQGTAPTNTFQAGTVNIKVSDAMSKGGVNYYSPIQNLKPGNCLIKTITITNDRPERILLRAKITEAWTGTVNGSKDISTVKRDLSNIQWYIDNAPWPKADWIFNNGYWYYAGVLSPAGATGSPNGSSNGKIPAESTTFLTRICVDSSLTDSAYQGATYTINITFESIPAAADLELDQWNHDWPSGTALNWDNGNTWIAADLMSLYNDRVYDPLNLEDIKDIEFQPNELQNDLM